MIKIYCDICGNHIKFSFFSGPTIKDVISFVNDDRHFFCSKCFNKFIAWRNSQCKKLEEGVVK